MGQSLRLEEWGGGGKETCSPRVTDTRRMSCFSETLTLVVTSRMASVVVWALRSQGFAMDSLACLTLSLLNDRIISGHHHTGIVFLYLIITVYPHKVYECASANSRSTGNHSDRRDHGRMGIVTNPTPSYFFG